MCKTYSYECIVTEKKSRAR